LLCPPIPNDRFNSAIADRKAEINPKDPVLANTTARSDVTPFHALICDACVQPKSRTRKLRDCFHARAKRRPIFTILVCARCANERALRTRVDDLDQPPERKLDRKQR
jgi:hypothetical protein